MFDARVYIGDTSVFFLNRYPAIFVYALEPKSEITRLLSTTSLSTPTVIYYFPPH